MWREDAIRQLLIVMLLFIIFVFFCFFVVFYLDEKFVYFLLPLSRKPLLFHNVFNY